MEYCVTKWRTYLIHYHGQSQYLNIIIVSYVQIISRSYPGTVEPLQNGFVEEGFQEKVRSLTLFMWLTYNIITQCLNTLYKEAMN